MHDAQGNYRVHGYLLGTDGSFAQVDYPSALETNLASINNLGEIFGGYFDNAHTSEYGFLIDTNGHFITRSFPGAKMTRLAASYGVGILGNYSFNPDFHNPFSDSHAFFSGKDGIFTTIEPPNAVASWAGGISDLGQFSGTYRDPAGNIHGYMTVLRNSLILTPSSAAKYETAGSNEIIRVGYAKIAVSSGSTPYGTAVFSYKEGGVTVSEAGVPASPPTASARILIDYRSSVNAVPARSDAGIVSINTGIAVVNYGTAIANVTYTLRNASGSTIATGHGTIAEGRHISCFIDQLKEAAASDFNLPADFQTAIQFGALDIASDQPLSVLALRGTTNQRQQFIVSTTPVADLTNTPSGSPMYFAQFADGGGYTTSLFLMNTSTANETGILQIMDNNGAALVVNQVGGTSESSFRYSIPPNGIVHFQTDGSPGDSNVGWVQLAPDSGTSTPVGSGVFEYNPVNVLLTETGVPSSSSTTHARIYVDRSGNHNTGLAIANINGTLANITINAYQTDGVTAAGTTNGSMSLSAYGHNAKFADQLIAELPDGFTGILDVSSTTPFAALTVRSLYNENKDYLMTTFPVADVNQRAPSPIVFPQIADGGGYATQFILLSTGGAASTTIDYSGDDGTPFAP
jgi:hypothetical protein